MGTISYLDEWRICEEHFDPTHLGKFEAIMAQGNGYLGVRNTLAEHYPQERRNLFVAGVFNKFSEAEVTELANFPDVTAFDLSINGKPFSLLEGRVSDYRREFNYRNGEGVRSFIWEQSQGTRLRLVFRKFVSMADKHLMMFELTVKNLGDPVTVTVETGIDGTQTNSGSQHFEEGEKRFFENRYLYVHTNTTESLVNVALGSYFNIDHEHQSRTLMKRRQLQQVKTLKLAEGETFVGTKYVVIRTDRDLAAESPTYLTDDLISHLENVVQSDYATHMAASEKAWGQIWEEAKIVITSDRFQDQLLLNFARYHIHVMAPTHDPRLNIGAKGMSGEGYKGHTFWDTEIFLLPYFIYSFPDQGKNLVDYRIRGLTAAKRNAAKNGYQGAQYPWESAWLSDGEVTPKFGEIDLITGRPTPILTGEIEHHVTGDVIFGLSEYLQVTNDEKIRQQFFDVVMEAAKFWCSRVVYNETEDRFEILDVIGPDEYKEHVNNNAYTNYLAKYTLDQALAAYKQQQDPQRKAFYASDVPTIQQISAKIYLPNVNSAGILPQDDTYLTKKSLDLTKYLQDAEVNTLFLDYNLAQVNELQISKQADVLLLLLLFADEFSRPMKKANWDYYYPKTLHDSSLSLSTHCNLALEIGEETLAYQLFTQSFEIDLGEKNLKSSDMGIHAAAMGGIWQNVVKGFGGLKNQQGQLAIAPKLPKAWDALMYRVVFLGRQLEVMVTKTAIKITLLAGEPIEVSVNEEKYWLNQEITVKTIT